MSNKPQCPIEEIELLPHPLDAWRAALNALISVAPGVTADVAWHLKDASEKIMICRDFSAASQGEAKLIDRLMLLSAAKIFGGQLDTQKMPLNELGFTHLAPLIGIDLSAAAVRERQTDLQSGSASSHEHAARTEHLASSCSASSAQVLPGQPLPESQPAQPNKATPDSEHGSAPQSATNESLDRPSDESPCQ